MLPPPNRCIALRIFCILLFGFYQGHALEKLNEFDTEISNDSLVNSKYDKFNKKYNALIARAYFKLIVEAEKADISLGEEYKKMYDAFENNTMSEDLEAEFIKVYDKFLAHRRMLNGLKSWRVFSDFRTGDLAYFKAENYERIHKMYQRGANDFSMVKVLMHKLADLYHFGE
jgi:hypothetical protein